MTNRFKGPHFGAPAAEHALLWPYRVNCSEGVSRAEAALQLSGCGSCEVFSRGGERDARGRATMDQSDMCGLVTALHRFVAGLPASVGEVGRLVTTDIE
jgi:hypothetical protein